MSGWGLAGAVFVGSGLGGVCRYGVSLLSGRVLNGWLREPWPALTGTWAVNLLGSLALGWLMARHLTTGGFDGSILRVAAYRVGLMTGFMGGFTTYSTFNTELLRLMQAGDSRAALFYLATTTVSCLLGGWLGMSLAAP